MTKTVCCFLLGKLEWLLAASRRLLGDQTEAAKPRQKSLWVVVGISIKKNPKTSQLLPPAVGLGVVAQFVCVSSVLQTTFCCESECPN